MESVFTYKALSHKLFLYGFQSLDFFIVIGVPLFILFLTKSITVALIMLVIFWKIGKKLKLRTEHYFKSFLTYLMTPVRLSVNKYKENIPGYLAKGDTNAGNKTDAV